MREHTNAGDRTPAQLSVLLRLEQGDATVSGLARAEGMRPQSMGAIVAPLETAGLVRGTPDPKDGRQTMLSLTDACRAWIDEGRDARQGWLVRAIEANLTVEEQEKVTEAIALLKRLADG
jgi:DNA-binding MarR family transcriptional regulator